MRNGAVRCEAWLMTSANCVLSCMTLCTDIEVLTHLQYYCT